MNDMNAAVTIEFPKGGFILTYPHIDADGSTKMQREVFISPRKLNQRIKEVSEQLGLVTDKT